MRKFNSFEEVDSLTDAEALEIIERQFELLKGLGEHGAVGLDDHGDYLYAAITNYATLFDAYWYNDGQNPQFLDAVKAWLREPFDEWLGSDGEVRFELFTEEMQEAEWERLEAQFKVESEKKL
jgi:hypothetical protein